MSASCITASASILLIALACADPEIEVNATTLVLRDIDDVLVTNGRIEATERVAVHAAVSGRIERVLVRRGDSVERGQELVRLADAGQRELQRQADARLAAARARLAVLHAGLPAGRRAELEAERSRLMNAREAASENRERLERLVRRAAAPRVDLDAAKRLLDEHTISITALDVQLATPSNDARRAELEAAVREAESALAAANDAVAGLTVRAPGSGTLYSLPVARGDHVNAGGLIARLGHLDTVQARIFVDEPDLGRVRNRCLVSIATDAYPDRTWTCRVDRLAAEIVQMGTRRVGEVQCTVQNPDGRLLPNLAVGIRIVTESVRATPSVPRLAVQRSAGRAYVWTVEDSMASRREIVTGVEGPVHVEVLSGLGESDPVLLPAPDSVAPGQSVRVRWQGEGE